ncbi:sensor histidine kinase RegB [Stappia sp.]|uniref:sensor histidine kinase RegB n=1 Tax=Stappia sp. TaxID=1870903 RepID=UPI003A9A41A2
MAESDLDHITGEQRGNWIRLRTMVRLRWVAIAGQLGAVLVAQALYDLTLDLRLCFAVIGLSVIGNIVTFFVFPENKRLSETENLAMVTFDLLQLGALLYLTGGLHNPFSVLIVGPVTVAAAALSLRATIFIASVAILLVSVLLRYHEPLQTREGFELRVADVFLYGNWVAIIIAVIFLALYSRKIATEMHAMSDALHATLMALAREQKLTDLGGVVAAAAHELGTPLATIKLTSAELMEELEDRADLREDAALIREQADRCRDILRSMGRAGKDDLHLHRAPLSALIREAAEPHQGRGKTIVFDDAPLPGSAAAQPEIMRWPELIHGLRNLIQNAVDFAGDTIFVETSWSETEISIRIIDDGPGYPPDVIGRIGEPFVRNRRGAPREPNAARPEYEGMGLGLFIAKTLLERTGAEMSFANGGDPKAGVSGMARVGAIVEAVWPRSRLEAPPLTEAEMGVNRPIAV